MIRNCKRILWKFSFECKYLLNIICFIIIRFHCCYHNNSHYIRGLKISKNEISETLGQLLKASFVKKPGLCGNFLYKIFLPLYNHFRACPSCDTAFTKLGFALPQMIWLSLLNYDLFQYSRLSVLLPSVCQLSISYFIKFQCFISFIGLHRGPVRPMPMRQS